MNIMHELNRTGERSEWERFWPGFTYFEAADSGKFCCSKTDRFAIVIKTKQYPGSVDRAFEKMYADD